MSRTEYISIILSLRGKLKAYAYRLTENNDDAEDLVQDTYERLLKSGQCPHGKVEGWVLLTMKRLFINYYYKTQRRVTRETIASIEDKVIPDIDSTLEVERIHKAVDSLDRVYKTSISLVAYGYKYEEVAEKMGIG